MNFIMRHLNKKNIQQGVRSQKSLFRLHLETAPTCQPWLSSKGVQKLPVPQKIGVVKGDTRSLDPKP